MTDRRSRELLRFRQKVQLISQRPESFFDPRMRLGDSILETLTFYGGSRPGPPAGNVCSSCWHR